MSDEYNIVELPALNQLKNLGWTITDPKDLIPETSKERQSFKQVILKRVLSNSIKKLNPWIDDDNLKKVIREIMNISNLGLIEANQKIYNLITKYFSIEQDLGKGKKVKLLKSLILKILTTIILLQVINLKFQV
jgi:type I restriction enzyme R subunit